VGAHGTLKHLDAKRGKKSESQFRNLKGIRKSPDLSDLQREERTVKSENSERAPQRMIAEREAFMGRKYPLALEPCRLKPQQVDHQDSWEGGSAWLQIEGVFRDLLDG